VPSPLIKLHAESPRPGASWLCRCSHRRYKRSSTRENPLAKPAIYLRTPSHCHIVRHCKYFTTEQLSKRYIGLLNSAFAAFPPHPGMTSPLQQSQGKRSPAKKLTKPVIFEHTLPAPANSVLVWCLDLFKARTFIKNCFSSRNWPSALRESIY
jgi:hypothetical protein